LNFLNAISTIFAPASTVSVANVATVVPAAVAAPAKSFATDDIDEGFFIPAADKAASVFGPITPSAFNPFDSWNARISASVVGYVVIFFTLVVAFGLVVVVEVIVVFATPSLTTFFVVTSSSSIIVVIVVAV
jgi:hypothetical protein